MVLKIENKPLRSGSYRTRPEFENFVETLGELNVGQSFLWRQINSNDRATISIAQKLLKRRFITRREGQAYRVARVL